MRKKSSPKENRMPIQNTITPWCFNRCVSIGQKKEVTDTNAEERYVKEEEEKNWRRHIYQPDRLQRKTEEYGFTMYEVHRERGDMIETYKYIHGLHSVNTSLLKTDAETVTRGH